MRNGHSTTVTLLRRLDDRSTYLLVLSLGFGALGASLGFAFLAVRDFSSASMPAPLAVTEPVIDLGELRQGVTRRVSFKLHNQSRDAVLINKVSSGCSCASHELSQSQIEGGQSAILDLIYKSGTARGPVSASARIVYFQRTDGILHNVDVHIKAHVRPDITLSHDALEFPAGHEYSQTVTLTPNALDRFHVKRVACTHRAFSAAVHAHTNPAARNVLVQFDGTSFTSFQHHPELIIETDSAAEPLLRIPLKVHDVSQFPVKDD